MHISRLSTVLLCVLQHVDVSKLIKGRPLDNTEFMQWFKAYWDRTTGKQLLLWACLVFKSSTC